MEYISSVNNNNNNCENKLLIPDLDLKSKGQCNYFKSSYARSLSFSKNRTKSLLSVNCGRVNCESSASDELDNYNYTSVNVIDDIKMHHKNGEPSIEETHHLNHRCATNNYGFDSVVLQTQVNTLQWQLKQTFSPSTKQRLVWPPQWPTITEIEISNFSSEIVSINRKPINTLKVESTRQMYQTVLEEVVRFLKKCYQHLNLLVEPWPRSKSEKHILNNDINHENLTNFEPLRAQSTLNLRNMAKPCHLEREFHKFSVGSNNNNTFNLNLDTEKLSNEAFRLYRTTENLINMRGPTLMPASQNNNDPTETKTHEIISHANKTYETFLSDSEISGSIDLHEQKNNNIDRISLRSCTTGSIHSSSSKSSEATDEDMQQTSKTYSARPNVVATKRFNSSRNKSNHSISPNCIDVESGFSSMNSFQEIGLPLVNSTQNIMSPNFNSFSISNVESEKQAQFVNSVVESDCTIQRKWNSLPKSTKKTPAQLFEFKCDETLKVLWV